MHLEKPWMTYWEKPYFSQYFSCFTHLWVSNLLTVYLTNFIVGFFSLSNLILPLRYYFPSLLLIPSSLSPSFFFSLVLITVPSIPLLVHNSSSNKCSVLISAKNVPLERGLLYFGCVCVLERKAYYNIRPLCFPSFNTHQFFKMSLANTAPFAFVSFTNIFHLSPISYLQLLSVLLWKSTVPK